MNIMPNQEIAILLIAVLAGIGLGTRTIHWFIGALISAVPIAVLVFFGNGWQWETAGATVAAATCLGLMLPDMFRGVINRTRAQLRRFAPVVGLILILWFLTRGMSADQAGNILILFALIVCVFYGLRIIIRGFLRGLGFRR